MVSKSSEVEPKCWLGRRLIVPGWIFLFSAHVGTVFCFGIVILSWAVILRAASFGIRLFRH